MFAAFALVSIAPASTAGSEGGGAPQVASEVEVFYDGFEGAFPGAWTVEDGDPNLGEDYWARSSSRTAAGSASVWSAGEGSQRSDAVPFNDDFEGGLGGGWFLSAETDDAWGISTYRSYSGDQSLWAAQEGFNDYYGDYNANVLQYDNQMNTTIYRASGTADLSVATLEFYYWLDSESCCDYFFAVSGSPGAWTTLTMASGDSGGWQHASITFPPSDPYVGFTFGADDSIVAEGGYIDNVTVTGYRLDKNSDLRSYDGAMSARMWRSVDLSRYASSHLDFSYWTDTQAPNDYLAALYYTDTWHVSNVQSGASGGWGLDSASIPVNATRVGFFFSSDSSVQREGAYLDEIRLYGVVLPVECDLTVSASTGVEGSTSFLFSGVASQGLRPYIWSWDFGDGTDSSSQGPSHVYAEAGSYAPALTVADSLGQRCVASATITVLHDTSSMIVAPLSAQVTEGATQVFSGQDALGHGIDFTWSVVPPSCGSFAPALGGITTFTADRDAGGSLCTVTARYGGASASSSVEVTHDSSTITVTPEVSTVVEGQSVLLEAADANGHAADFLWENTCGRLSQTHGGSSMFTAATSGGQVCTVSATLGANTGYATVNVDYDTSTITITPSTATLTEGASQSFGAAATFGHPLSVAWSTEPSSCGTLSTTAGPSVDLALSVDAGGTTCTLRASYGGHSSTVSISVVHSTTLSLAPTAASVEEGGILSLSVADAYGHPTAAAWSLAPAACGALSPTSGAQSVFTASADAGGLACTVQAVAQGRFFFASVTVTHGAPAAVKITPATADVEEGASLPLTAIVIDAHGHDLRAGSLTWTTTCGSLTATSGVSTGVTATAVAPGEFCEVKATSGSLSATASIRVTHATPYIITVTSSSASTGPGGIVTLTAVVKDARGRTVEDAPITWSSTCGSVSPATGATTTFTAPGDLSGSSCTVTASSALGQSTGAGSFPVTATGTSTFLVGLAAVAVVVGLGAAILFLRRKSGRE